MHYIVAYELCSLLFLLLVTVRFFSVRRFPNTPNRLFGAILICAVADLSLDILGALTIEHINQIPPGVTELVNSLFYLLQVALPVLLMSYVVRISGLLEGRFRWRFPLLLIPAILIALLLLTNPFTGLVFTVESVAGSRTYVTHWGILAIYSSAFLYLLVTVVLAVLRRKQLQPKQYHTILIFIVLIVAALVVQLLIPQLILTGLAITSAILLMFFTLQNPEDLLDLTSGVFNYAAMTEFLQLRIRRGRPLYLIAVDVDGVRRINHTMGINTGNEALRAVGSTLHELNSSGWVFRMIGTRFLAVTPDLNSHRDLEAAITRRFSAPWTIYDSEVLLQATLRCCRGQNQFHSAEDVVTLLDMAYAEVQPSELGKSAEIGVACLARGQRRIAVEEALRAALATGEGFTLHYQPIHNPGFGRYTNLEVLLRFCCPGLGTVPPDEFIPIAEESGLIHQLDEMVIHRACEFLQRNPGLRTAGITTLEINLSAAEYFAAARERIGGIVANYGIEPSMLCFEITETIAASSRGALSDFMEAMVRDGYRFALDDFGTGYANVCQVVSQPFSIIKLDRTLLTAQNEANRIVFDDLLTMFSKLGKKVVAEGVETEEQVRRVTRLGADYIQGYYFSRPLPEEQLLPFLGLN